MVKLSGAANQPHFEDTDLGNRTIQRRTAGLHRRNGIHNIHAFDHLPEDRVLLIQMGCAAKLRIYGTLVHAGFFGPSGGISARSPDRHR